MQLGLAQCQYYGKVFSLVCYFVLTADKPFQLHPFNRHKVTTRQMLPHIMLDNVSASYSSLEILSWICGYPHNPH